MVNVNELIKLSDEYFKVKAGLADEVSDELAQMTKQLKTVKKIEQIVTDDQYDSFTDITHVTIALGRRICTISTGNEIVQTHITNIVIKDDTVAIKDGAIIILIDDMNQASIYKKNGNIYEYIWCIDEYIFESI